MIVFPWPLWRARKRPRLPDGRRKHPGDVLDRLEKVTSRLEEAVSKLEDDLDLDGVPDKEQTDGRG